MIYAHHCEKSEFVRMGKVGETYGEAEAAFGNVFCRLDRSHLHLHAHAPPLPHLQPCDPWPPSYAHMGRGTSTAEIFLTLFLNSELGIQVDLLTGPFFSSRKR